MTNELIPRQYSFLDSLLDPRVRRMWNDDGFYVSILDVLEYHGHKTNPRLSWKQTLDWMTEKQGFKPSSIEIIQHQFAGQGQRKTPVIHEDLFYRILQSADVPEWEPLRVFGAALMKQEVSKPKQPFKPIQSPMFRRAIDAGYTREEAEGAALIRERLKDRTKETNEVRAQHGANDPRDFARLNALDSQVATGKTPAQWRKELGEEVTPADYMSPLDNISLAYEKLRAAQEHEANQSRGVDEMAQDIQTITPEVKNNKKLLGELLQGVPLPAPKQGKQLALKDGK